MMRAATVRADRYTRGAIAFHWTIAALVAVNLWIGLVAGPMAVHKAIGITVLVLTVARIGWRIAHPAPPFPSTLTRWERLAVRWSHRAFYVLLLALPMSGWAMSSGGQRRPLEWFGLFPIPYLPVSPAAADAGHDVHGVFGWAMLALVALHVAAALRHRFILRDGVLERMLPGAGPRG